MEKVKFLCYKNRGKSSFYARKIIEKVQFSYAEYSTFLRKLAMWNSMFTNLGYVIEEAHL